MQAIRGTKRPHELLVTKVTQEMNSGNWKKPHLISHSEMEKIIGIDRIKPCGCRNRKYTETISKANNELIGQNLLLQAVNGYGYRIVEDNMYVVSMKLLYNQAVKCINKAGYIRDNTNTSNLNSTELKEWTNVSNAINNAKVKQIP